MARMLVVAAIVALMTLRGQLGQCQTAETTALRPAAARATTPGDAVVTRLDKAALLALLKELQFTPTRQEASERGWSMTNPDAKKGEIFQFSIAVCGSREAARAMYEHDQAMLSTTPHSLAGPFTVGDASTIGMTWAFFVRDNVFVDVIWKEGWSSTTLTQLDKFLMTASPSVHLGRFEVVPRLKDIPDTAVISAGQAKDIPVACEGMGKGSPAVWVSSPGSMGNHVVDATVRLKVLPYAKEAEYPVQVCAVGEGLVFATATIDVVVKPAAAQPATSQTATKPVGTAPATQSGGATSPTNPKR